MPVCIKIFTTGGTIDKVYFDAQSDYKVGDPQANEILRNVGVTVEVEVETLLRKDSLDLTDEDRALIAERVRTDSARRILVTHGTDTMAETARSLGDTGDKTVVFVGSLSPARFKGTDAEFNIGFAMAAVQLLPPGAYVAMNGRVFRADEVIKNRAANRFEGDSYHPDAAS
jgi:L-asparaginase